MREEEDNNYMNDDQYDDEQNNIDNVDELEDKLFKSRGKPRQIGKHSLKHDEIFRTTKQKKQEQLEEFDHIIDTNTEFSISDEIHGEDDENNVSSINYYRFNKLKDEIRNLLETYTEVKMDAKRRKPSKSDFNAYFKMICKELNDYGYMKTEIFIELAGYFTLENYWNIFKLLDTEYADIIINELKEKHGINDKIDYINFF